MLLYAFIHSIVCPKKYAPLSVSNAQYALLYMLNPTKKVCHFMCEPLCGLCLSNWLLCFCMLEALECFYTLLHAFIILCFHTFSNAFKHIHKLAYTCIRFHTLSYASICFHMLPYAFIMLWNAFICSYICFMSFKS